MELNFDAAVLIGEDLLAGGSHDDRGLRALNGGVRRDARRPERRGVGDAVEIIGVVGFGLGAAALEIAGLAGGVADGSQQPGLVHVVPVVFLEIEAIAAGEGAAIAAVGHHQRGLKLLEAGADELVAVSCRYSPGW